MRHRWFKDKDFQRCYHCGVKKNYYGPSNRGFLYYDESGRGMKHAGECAMNRMNKPKERPKEMEFVVWE